MRRPSKPNLANWTILASRCVMWRLERWTWTRLERILMDNSNFIHQEIRHHCWESSWPVVWGSVTAKREYRCNKSCNPRTEPQIIYPHRDVQFFWWYYTASWKREGWGSGWWKTFLERIEWLQRNHPERWIWKRILDLYWHLETESVSVFCHNMRVAFSLLCCFLFLEEQKKSRTSKIAPDTVKSSDLDWWLNFNRCFRSWAVVGSSFVQLTVAGRVKFSPFNQKNKGSFSPSTQPQKHRLPDTTNRLHKQWLIYWIESHGDYSLTIHSVVGIGHMYLMNCSGSIEPDCDQNEVLQELQFI